MLVYLILIDNPSDEDFFIKIYNKHRSGMVKYATSIIKDETLAEDIVHNTFLKLAKTIYKWKNLDKDSQKAYIFVSVKNQTLTTINKLNKEQKYYNFDDNKKYSYKDEIQKVENLSDLGEIYSVAIEVLSDILVEVLILKYDLGYKNKEIAKLLNVSANIVAQRLSQMKKTLKIALIEKGYSHENK